MAFGLVWNVTSCNDDGPGTLRNIIATQATSGDVVNLDTAPCSAITLGAGQSSIAVLQSDLRIQKGGLTRITIDGSALKSGETNGADSRIFTHVAPFGALFSVAAT